MKTPNFSAAAGHRPDYFRRLALLGYLAPLLAIVLGAALGAGLAGTHGAAALGAIVGFLLALTLARVVIGLLSAPVASPLLFSTSRSSTSFQELDHE